MALGEGRYDDLCTYVREHSGGVGAIVIVIDGKLGQGFSVQAPIEALLMLPGVLRHIASTIEGDLPKQHARN